MAMIDGIKLTGYNFVEKDVQVCGLASIAGFAYNNAKPPWDVFLSKLALEAGYTGKGEGNFLFAVTEGQIAKTGYYSDYDMSFLWWLLKQPGTKILHHYNNNAHAPWQRIFICIHHMHLDKVKREDLTNNVVEYLTALGVDTSKVTPE